MESSAKLRLMCSYGGHIVPRPHDKSLFYADGETRIVSVDRRTTAASLSSLSAHLSRSLFNNHPFHLKYQLPSEDLDSLISVITNEDLSNMLDEHDRTTAPARIRLFLFPVKPESLGSALLDPKSESWFCDALKNTRILHSSDSELRMALGSDSEAPVEIGSKLSAESLVLETSSSFGSNGSSSIESENTVERAAFPSTTGIFQHQLIESARTIYDPSISIPTVQGGLQYVPQYPVDPLASSPYCPLYQMPIAQQHIPCTSQDQPYPVYLVPAKPTQYHQVFDNKNASSRPPLHQYNAVNIPTIVHKGAPPIAESTTKVYRNVPATPPIISIPCNQGQQVTGRFEAKNPSEPVLTDLMASVIQCSEFDEDFAYNQIYKTQPTRPVLPFQYQKMTKGTTMKLSELHPL